MKYEIIKGSDKDFEGAPEWCTHVSKSGASGCLAWEVSDITKDGNKYQWVDSMTGDDCVYSGADGIILDIIAERRPITEPVFSVEWLPPVGSRIEYTCIKPDNGHPAIEFGNWYGGTVIAYYEGFVWTSDNGIRRLENTIFRPMKSPEDVAGGEAKGIIAELCRSSASNGHSADLIYEAIITGNVIGITKTPTVSELMRVTEKATREDCEAIVKMMENKND